MVSLWFPYGFPIFFHVSLFTSSGTRHCLQPSSEIPWAILGPRLLLSPSQPCSTPMDCVIQRGVNLGLKLKGGESHEILWKSYWKWQKSYGNPMENGRNPMEILLKMAEILWKSYGKWQKSYGNPIENGRNPMEILWKMAEILWKSYGKWQKSYGNPIENGRNPMEILWKMAEILWKSYGKWQKSYGNPMENGRNPMEILWKSFGK